MSKEAITKVVQRAISDAGFRRQLTTDPTGALRGFDLTADEAAALRAGDAGRLSALGVDQRMSKAFVIGGVTLTASRQAGSDLTPGGATSSVQATDGGGALGNAMVSGTNANAALIDDGGTAGARSVIPGDPDSRLGADADNASGISNAAKANDDPDGFLAANANADFSGSGQSVRAGDDWKYTGGTSQAAAAPIEGSPEATAADLAKGGGMAAYPSNAAKPNDDPDGFLAANANADLSGIGQSVRAGDDWKFTGGNAQSAAAPIEGSPEAAAADLAKGGGMAAYPSHGGLAGPSQAGSVRSGDDWARASGAQADTSARSGTARLDESGASSARSSAASDDPDGFLAANANADLSGATTNSAATGDGTAFIDDSEAYLTRVGYDAGAASKAVTDAHDRATWSGDENAGPTDDDGGASGNSATEGGPNITP